MIAGIGLGLAARDQVHRAASSLRAADRPRPVRPLAKATAGGGARRAGRDRARRSRVALAAFLFADPYALLDFSAFHNGILHQSAASDDATGKLGLTHGSGITYYLWTLTWGLGWVPALAALGGSIALWWHERRLIVVLVPGVIIFLLFMGSQGRYFGRWLMPGPADLLPPVGLRRAPGGRPDRRADPRELRPTMIAVAVVALCGQGVVHSVHSGLVDSRADTRNQARAFMVANVPRGRTSSSNLSSPTSGPQDIGHVLGTVNGARWIKYPATHTQVGSDGVLAPGAGPVVNIEDYEKTLQPALVSLYEDHGYCYVVYRRDAVRSRPASTRGRSRRRSPTTRTLAQQGTLVYPATPYSRARARSRSTSTGPSTTTRSPTPTRSGDEHLPPDRRRLRHESGHGRAVGLRPWRPSFTEVDTVPS